MMKEKLRVQFFTLYLIFSAERKEIKINKYIDEAGDRGRGKMA